MSKVKVDIDRLVDCVKELHERIERAHCVNIIPDYVHHKVTLVDIDNITRLLLDLSAAVVDLAQAIKQDREK